MRILTIATALVSLVSFGAARAADMPLKGPPPPPPAPWTWTGFYIGVNGGAGFGQVDQQLNLPFISDSAFLPLVSQPISGFLAGGQIGYNWQLPTYPIVIGIEGEGDWADLHGSASCPLAAFGFAFAMQCNVRANWIADVAGRVGFTLDQNRALIYVKGGVAWEGNDYKAVLAPVFIHFPFTESETKVGGLLGMGVEYAFLPNWSAKIEYDFIDFGTSTNQICAGFAPCFPIPTNVINVGVRETVSEVKFGVNYRFSGWGMP
jgi:outer membrane immunogenic protein